MHAEKGSPRLGVVMAGGSGERFWPLSTPQRPKQLLRLTSPDETMLEEAVRRLLLLFKDGHVFVATSTTLRDPIIGSGILPVSHVLTEPGRRNTLGAFAWLAANLLANHLGEATVAVVTADHMIGEPDRFRATVAAAMDVAENEDSLVTIGVRPTRPETGYGYIEIEPEAQTHAEDGRPVYDARCFREKPPQAQAEEFVAAGNFLWNSGMFFFRVPNLMREMKAAQPEVHDTIQAMAEAISNDNLQAAASAFETLPNLSIDYALMEKAGRMHVLISDFPWDDVGAWDALERSLPLDDARNVIQGEAALIETGGSIIVNEASGVRVGVLGMEDVIVIVTSQGVLVAPKSRAQDVKRVVAALNA